jgi:hypothetical protein
MRVLLELVLRTIIENSPLMLAYIAAMTRAGHVMQLSIYCSPDQLPCAVEGRSEDKNCERGFTESARDFSAIAHYWVRSFRERKAFAGRLLCNEIIPAESTLGPTATSDGI